MFIIVDRETEDTISLLSEDNEGWYVTLSQSIRYIWYISRGRLEINILTLKIVNNNYDDDRKRERGRERQRKRESIKKERGIERQGQYLEYKYLHIYSLRDT